MASHDLPKSPRDGRDEIGRARELVWRVTFDRAVELAAELGLRPEGFLDAVGKKYRPDLRSEPRVSLDLLARFLSWAATESGDASFGLRLGASIHPTDFGAYGYLLLNCPTLREAMLQATRFIDFMQQGEAFTWKVTPDRYIEIRYGAQGLEEDLRRQDAECTLAIIHMTLKRLAGRMARPVEARFQHAFQAASLRAEDYFGCPIAYCDRDNALRYEVSLLDLPIRGADPTLLSILTQYVEREVEELPPQSDELGRIRWAIRRSLSTARLGVELVARQCGLGERTLQRRLAQHGLTFSGLVDLVRQEVHAELGQSGRRSLRETAELLGFSDASALSKAKRRWARENRSEAPG